MSARETAWQAGADASEVLGPEGSVAKLVWSDVSNHLAEAWSDVLGPDGWTGPHAQQRVSVRQVSISAGSSSTEVTSKPSRTKAKARSFGLARSSTRSPR